jgi:hypothetical protein
MPKKLHSLRSILGFVIFCLLTFTLIASLVPAAFSQFTLSALEDLKRNRNTINIFENVTTNAGIKWTGEPGGFSTAWTDFNSDGLPDLWVSPHIYESNGNATALSPTGTRFPKLYVNRGNGTFNNVLPQIWTSNINNADTHGSAWADFDNDGDPDLMVMRGAKQGTGEEPSFLFINESGKLKERGAALGLDFPKGRGRSPLWFDWNKDGWLDLLEINEKRPDGQAPTTLFQQTANGFQNVNAVAGLRVCSSADSAQVADLFGNETLDVLLLDPVKVYENADFILKDMTGRFLRLSEVRDAVIADFNRDSIPDIFFLRSRANSFNFRAPSDIYQTKPDLAFARLKIESGQVGISFQTKGKIVFDFSFIVDDDTTNNKIFIGSKGFHPSKRSFSLSSDDPTVIGILPHSRRNSDGIYIGYNSDKQIWEAFLDNPSPNVRSVNLILATSESLTNLTPIGFTSVDRSKEALPPVLLVYDSKSSRYIDKTIEAELNTPLLGNSVVAGDFDNDMDVDLLISSSSQYIPLPATFYENQGNGTFVAIANAAGAAGNPVGSKLEYINLGLNLAVADYDVDGFLDVYMAESTMQGYSQNYLGSPPQLFHNIGNSNHWVEIDLQGTNSNRDGIGTKVLATTNGITQLREQNGGMHAWSQNQQRLHLGLGKNNQVDRLVIQWPSGQVQELTNIAADQVLRVVESRTYDNNNLEKRGASDVVSSQKENNRFIECPSILPKKKIALIISIFLLGSFLGALCFLWSRKKRSSRVMEQ